MADLSRRVHLLTVAVIALALILGGVLVFLAAPAIAGGVLPPPPKSTTACAHTLGADLNYYVEYNLTTGQVVGMDGSNGSFTPTTNNTVIDGSHPGVINITSQPALVGNMVCWWTGGNSGPVPWHVDLVTGQVLATAQPPPAIPTYLWLDPAIVVGTAGGFLAWRLLLRRRQRPPKVN